MKGRDNYGKKIELNFNDKGSTHNTTLGGIMTTLVQLLFAVYIGVKGYKMVNSLSDSNQSLMAELDLEALGPVNWNSTNMLLYF